MSLKKVYQEIAVPELKKLLNTDNLMALPKITKTIISMRVSEGKESKEILEEAKTALSVITGQGPVVCRARRAISGFKLREGDPIGLKVTLRRKRMNDFLEKLFVLVLPRLRDFKGLPLSSFDDGANFNIGLNDITVFPEIDFNKIKKNFGLQITLVTNTRDEQASRTLLESLGMPFAK